MRALNRWDWASQLAFLSLHDPRTRKLCPDLSHDDLMLEIYLIDPQRRRYHGVEALRIAAKRIPLLWPIVPLLYVPGSLPLLATGYRTLARWRYKFGRNSACDDGNCAVHFESSQGGK